MTVTLYSAQSLPVVGVQSATAALRRTSGCDETAPAAARAISGTSKRRQVGSCAETTKLEHRVDRPEDDPQVRVCLGEHGRAIG
eukprot:s4566_g2.t1